MEQEETIDFSTHRYWRLPLPPMSDTYADAEANGDADADANVRDERFRYSPEPTEGAPPPIGNNNNNNINTATGEESFGVTPSSDVDDVIGMDTALNHGALTQAVTLSASKSLADTPSGDIDPQNRTIQGEEDG